MVGPPTRKGPKKFDNQFILCFNSRPELLKSEADGRQWGCFLEWRQRALFHIGGWYKGYSGAGAKLWVHIWGKQLQFSDRQLQISDSKISFKLKYQELLLWIVNFKLRKSIIDTLYYDFCWQKIAVICRRMQLSPPRRRLYQVLFRRWSI